MKLVLWAVLLGAVAGPCMIFTGALFMLGFYFVDHASIEHYFMPAIMCAMGIGILIMWFFFDQFLNSLSSDFPPKTKKPKPPIQAVSFLNYIVAALDSTYSNKRARLTV